MRANQNSLETTRKSPLSPSLILLPLLLLAGCSGSTGPRGADGPPGGSLATDTNLKQGDTTPGIEFNILELTGGHAAGGRFRAGDTIAVHYTVKKTDGSDWDIAELASGRALVSGPTSNYQRVIAEQQDLFTASVAQDDGSYVYTFPVAIPANYIAPLNDTATFGAADGELTGQALLDGTYTVAIYGRWNYTIDGAALRLTNDTELDFVIGNTGTAVARAVVGQENCNRCHDELQAHGGSRRSVTLCLMCHTAGAEDKNVPSVAGGTPNVTIDFKVMIHKLHNAAHLPSVLGVSTNPDGSRNYAATAEPYEIVGFNNSLNDFSEIEFPVWPAALVAMPRDQGYTALSSTDKATEDTLRKGVSNCLICHGDPDGAGPIAAPAQGDSYKTNPSELACYSCHDDVIPGTPYTANGQTMPDTADNTNCALCHVDPGTPVSEGIEVAHTHPLLDPTFNPGLHVNISAVSEAGTNDDDGTIDPGEKVALTFTITDDTGTAVDPSTLGNFTCVLSGPTSNYNVIADATVPVGMVTGTPPYTVNVPQPVLVERAGISTAAAGEVFHTQSTPLWNMTGATTTVYTRTATSGGSSTLTADVVSPVNYIDVADATGFARDDYIVVDDGQGAEEYAKIQTVDGTRLWFGANGSTTYPYGMLHDHASGATVKEVTLTTKTLTTDYTLNAANGAITEVTEFGNGNVVLCSYTTDFVMPAVFPMTLDDSPDQDERTGQWTTKPIVDGTYSVSLWSAKTTVLSLYGETNSYRWANDASTTDFLVGDATTITPYALISSGDNCNACHQDVGFHGYGRRGFQTCIVCHGGAGTEDRTNYIAPNSPNNADTTVDFRQMLHAIHMGKDLAYPTGYYIVGGSNTAYPNNYALTTFETVGFPSMPSGVKNCAKCHGSTNTAWHAPADRTYPAGQTLPFQGWKLECGACHDADDAQAHISIMTSTDGVESCELCHGASAEWNVQRMHKTY
ncbi:MAG: hypothetical protein IPJ19_06130 [Planctomycetes bacterium]|nr:hypothetical protein [Planctomycetota bacterium]